MAENTNMEVLVSQERLDLSMGGVKSYVDASTEKVGAAAEKAVADLETSLTEKVDAVEAKADAADAKADAVETTVGALVEKVNTVETKANEVETKVTEVQAKVDETETKVTTLETKVDDALKDVPEDGSVQPASPALNSLAGLTGTGYVTMTGPDTFALVDLDDDNIDPDTALGSAVEAFSGKDGTAKVSGLVTEGGNKYVDATDTVVTVGTTTTDTILEAKLDVNGKPAVYMTTPEGTNLRVAGIEEVKALIAAAEAGVASYRGKFTFFEDGDVDLENFSVSGSQDGDNAVVHSHADKKVRVGTFNGTDWTLTEVEWNAGDYAMIEHIHADDTNDGVSGRIIWNKDDEMFDILPNSDSEVVPDDIGITLNEDGKLSFRMVVNAEQYGEGAVSAALNASNIGYGEGMTIAQKIQELDYRIATEDEIKAMIEKYFPSNSESEGE